MQPVDFLKPGVDQIRHQIRNIVESYNHDWDLFAELAQNSVDAISLGEQKNGEIRISIDSLKKEIEFEDNGCGIPPNDLPGLLTPFATGKAGHEVLIGQKGVGISFVMFRSELFQIESFHKDGSSRAEFRGASQWLNADDDDLPKLEFEKFDSSNSALKFGTRITIKLPQNSDDQFWDYSFDQLVMILFTRTALGDVETIWGKTPDKTVRIALLDKSGDSVSKNFDCSYFLPTKKIPKNCISLDEFKGWLTTGDWSDLHKRKKIKDKVITHIGKESISSGREIKFWACLVPKRSTWDQISASSKLVDKSISDLSADDRANKYGEAHYLFSGGMFTSTRGMPTGIQTGMRAKGWAGYLPNFFILIDDPGLSFDIGRKSIPGRQIGVLKDIADKVFSEFLKVVAKYMGGDHVPIDEKWDRSATFNEIRKLPDLNSPVSKFLKRPSNQEATIAAMFFELLGAGRLDQFKPYISGYKNRYDLYATMNNADVVIEFKATLSALLKDFDDERKMFDEIDLVVIWEVTESDYSTIKQKGLDLLKTENSLMTESSNFIDYQICLGPTSPIGVICIKDLLFPPRTD